MKKFLYFRYHSHYFIMIWITHSSFIYSNLENHLKYVILWNMRANHLIMQIIHTNRLDQDSDVNKYQQWKLKVHYE